MSFTAQRSRFVLTVVLLAVLSGGCAATAGANPAPAARPAPAASTAALPPAPPAVAPPATAPVSATPCAPTAKACLSLAERQAWLTDGAGHVVYGPVPARGGKPSGPTPVGTFRVLSKDRNYYSTEFDAPMPYSVFFYPGDAFHADNPSVASNGCVHLNASAAQRFFDALQLGDEVQVVS